MPGGDGTGPMGKGGWCAPLWQSNQMPVPRGRGFWRRGMGFSRGFGWRTFTANPFVELKKEQEIQFLENERRYIEQEQEILKKELEGISKKIGELKRKN